MTYGSGGVTILEGITIGDGAIVGAGALVAKDLPPYSISVGVPAKPIRYRFDERTVNDLLAARWWDRPSEWVKRNADAFEDVSALLELLRRDG